MAHTAKLPFPFPPADERGEKRERDMEEEGYDESDYIRKEGSEGGSGNGEEGYKYEDEEEEIAAGGVTTTRRRRRRRSQSFERIAEEALEGMRVTTSSSVHVAEAALKHQQDMMKTPSNVDEDLLGTPLSPPLSLSMSPLQQYQQQQYQQQYQQEEKERCYCSSGEEKGKEGGAKGRGEVSSEVHTGGVGGGEALTEQRIEDVVGGYNLTDLKKFRGELIKYVRERESEREVM
jgi:hypothetical protein